MENFISDKGRLPCTALVQSQGSGKSRLIKELAKTMPTLYVCMRSELSQAYPARSASMEFFDSLEHDESGSKVAILKNSLLLAINDLTDFWLEQECNVRGDILEKAWKFQEESIGFFKKEFTKSKLLSDKEREKIWDKFGKVTKEKGKKTSDQSPVKIMLVFDEARYLLSPVDKSNDRPRSKKAFTLYKALKQVLNEERSHGIFSLLIDTMSKLSDFIPPEIPTSERGHYMHQHMPLYQLDTFDVGLIGHRFSLDLHADPCLFFRMGRPLWKMLDNEYKDVSNSKFRLEERLQLAASGFKGENGMLAALMIIYDIAIQPNPHLAQSLVSSHWAFMTFVGPNNKIVEIRYRSEPLLALCAHDLIRKQEKEEASVKRGSEKSVFDRLTDLLDNNVISTGERGELLARVLLTRPTSPKETVNVQTQFRTMNVADYLRQFGVEVSRNLVSTHGIIHLSHWTRAETPLTLSVLVQAWYRGCGIICKVGQEGIDLIIPIFIDDEKGENHKAIEALKLKADSLRDRDLSENQAHSLKKMMGLIAFQIKTNPHSNDQLKKEKFLERVVPIVEDCCGQPSYLMHWQMSKGKKNQNVVVEQVEGGHTYVKRVGLDDLGLTPQELVVANSLVLNVIPKDGDEEANQLSRNFNLFFKDFKETRYADYCPCKVPKNAE